MRMNLPLVARGVNDVGLQKLTESLTHKCQQVKAAIAYASFDNMTLLTTCKNFNKALTFYGRYDESVPVHPDIIKWFLKDVGPNFICRVVPEYLHAKVIWWVGEGVYIGSANMTQRAWYNNIEAGIFVNQDEITSANMHGELERFFAFTHELSRPISDEFYRHLLLLSESRKAVEREEAAHKKRISPFFTKDGELARGTTTKSESKSYLNFERDWNESLSFLRSIGNKLSLAVNRPDWVPEQTEMGAHVDQFIHAYYYKKVRGDQGEDYIRSAHDTNRLDRSAALDEAIAWWKEADFDYQQERMQIVDWASLIQETFQRGRILHLSEFEFSTAMARVHALREVARYRKNNEIGLPIGQQDLDVKISAHLKTIWRARNKEGQNILQLLDKIIWTGGGRIEWRIWAAANRPNLKIPTVGQNTLGELIGWALPHTYVPRNNRTIKGLYSLGYPVRIYDEAE